MDPVITYVETSRVALLFLLLIVAAYTDMVHQKVYNWSTFPTMILGLALACSLGMLRHDVSGEVSNALLGLGAGFGIFLVAYVVGGISAGDVKLVAAIGALGGFPFIIDAIVWSAVVGAILATGRLALAGRLLVGLRSSTRFMLALGRHESGLTPPPAEQEAPTGEAGDPEAAEQDEAVAAEPAAAGTGALTIPYGLAISVGTMWAFFLGNVAPVT